MQFTEPFPSFLFIGDNLVTFYVINDLGLYFGFHIATYGEGAIGIHQQDFGKFHLVTGISFQVGDIKCLIFGNLELLTGYFYNCEHDSLVLIPKKREAKVRVFCLPAKQKIKDL